MVAALQKHHDEDYLANRIMKDIGKNSIDAPVSRQIGSILSIEKAFGSMGKFCKG